MDRKLTWANLQYEKQYNISITFSIETELHAIEQLDND